jgi:hypothetical protein
MIHRFVEVIPNLLFRGSAPSPDDVRLLKEKLKINKIISLDQLDADRISRACKLLDIEQVIIPIEFDSLYEDIFKLLKFNLKELLLDNAPTFVHCHAGKDRTGLLIGLFKTKYLGMDPEDAINEAVSLGFGVGLDPKVVTLFKKLIRNSKLEKDNLMSKLDGSNIVSNQREYISDNRDTFLDEGRRGSFAPYLTPTRQYPMDALYVYINDQSPTRENYNRPVQPAENKDIVPLVGLFNNDAGIRGVGPVENYSGFFYD